MINRSYFARCVLYADDTNLYLSSSSISNRFATANEALTEYKGWFDANKLTLNAGKTQYMVFHRKQRTLPATLAKFLGVIIDSNLSWNLHISNLSRKLAKYSPILYRIRKHCMNKPLKLIYSCLIYSNLIYCISVWGHCKKKCQ